MEVAHLDIAFVVDATISMSERFPRARKLMSHVAEYLADAIYEERGIDLHLRMGLIAFTDYNPKLSVPVKDQSVTWVVQHFTDDLEEIHRTLFIEQGGEDEPEAVLAGLHAALNHLDWEGKHRLVVLMTDSAPHGRRFHQVDSGRPVDDSFPDGDPTGLNLEKVCKQLVKSNTYLWLFALSPLTVHFGELLQETYDILFKRKDMFLSVPMPQDKSYVELTVNFIHSVADDILCLPYTLLQICRHEIWMDPARYKHRAHILPADLLEYLDWQLPESEAGAEGSGSGSGDDGVPELVEEC